VVNVILLFGVIFVAAEFLMEIVIVEVSMLLFYNHDEKIMGSMIVGPYFTLEEAQSLL
jgi:hypothetical protein